MQSKYNRSLSGLPDNQSGVESDSFLNRRSILAPNDKLTSIYTSINSQRLFEQQREQRKHHSTLYDMDVQQKYSFKNDPQIKRALNQDKVKRSLNLQENLESDKENMNVSKKNFIKVVIEKSPTKNTQAKKDHKNIDNENLLLSYSDEILDYIKSREESTTPLMCLEKHNIPSNLRAKMVDWMIEVLASYKCTEQTFFLAVRVMDKFLQQTDKVHEIQDLHLTGVTSMFIACKYEEIYPMKLQVVHEKIAHRKLSIEAIKKKESDILAAIGFNLVGGTIYEVYNHLLIKVGLDKQLESKIYNYMKKICLYLAKMILYEYELVNYFDCFLLSCSLIFVAFKIIEQIQPSFKSEIKVKINYLTSYKIKEIIEAANIPNDKLIELASKVLNLAKGFEKQYANLENLKKFNGFQMEDIEEDEKKKTSL